MNYMVSEKGSDLTNALSLSSNSTLSAPLLGAVQGVGFVSIFLDNAMLTVVVFLAILSTQLIYSLMISDVDEKTYDYGMLRALGFQSKSLMTLISLQAFSFSIPGLALGLIVACILNYLARFIIFDYSQNTTTYALSIAAILLGMFLGLVIPLISNIIPIQRALSKNLRDSLNLYHKTINELTVKIKRLEEIGLSLT